MINIPWLTEFIKNWRPGRRTEIVRQYGIICEQTLALADFAHFCHANRTTQGADPTEMAINEGKRQAFIYLMQMRNLSDQDYSFLEREMIHDGTD